ncbi:MAG: hypothetical protein NKF70_00070 [Methanobacterium sp. ERen5]|nr:MAG: hypothetical protein NKF70_00070 [Methanobacterium sp. ERen5]
MAVLDFLNPRLLIKLKENDKDYTEFKFLTSFEPSNQDDSDTLSTSTGTVQVGNAATGAEVKIEGIELPDNAAHAKAQHRIITQGRKGFYEAKFSGEANLANGETVVESWLMRNGTFLADDSWSPTDKLKRKATLKASEIIKTVDGYDGKSEL